MARWARTARTQAVVACVGIAALGAVIPAPSGTVPAVRTSGSPTPVFDHKLEWPLVLLGADQLWARTEGTGITVAVVDTGIDTGPPELAGAVAGYPGASSTSGNGLPGEAHGTAVAGLIAGRGSAADPRRLAGLAPQAVLLDIKVATKPDGVTPDQMAQGIDEAVAAGARVINVSLASGTSDPQLDEAVANALAQHRLVVASAGDSGKPAYPASYPGVLMVGPADHKEHPLISLSPDHKFAIYAPGTDLYSIAVPGYHRHASGGYAHDLGGSDYAAAFVSAAAALLLAADPGLSPQQAGSLLVKTANRQRGSAAGSINPLAALSQLTGPPPPPPPSPPPPPPVPAGTGLTAAELLLIVAGGLLIAAGAFWRYRRRIPIVPTSWDEPW
jgi:membrane-anchored mycosin MYCP